MAILKCIREIGQTPVNDKRCHNVEKPKLPPPLRCNDHPCAARYFLFDDSRIDSANLRPISLNEKSFA